jgi:hypothetical protein
LQNSPLESSCVVVALTENYSIQKFLKASPEKSQILSSDMFVANERYTQHSILVDHSKVSHFFSGETDRIKD